MHASVINVREEKRERDLGFYMHFISRILYAFKCILYAFYMHFIRNIFYHALVISIQRYSHSVRCGETRAAHSLR